MIDVPLADLLGLSPFNWLLLAVSTAAALAIVERLRISNWWMVPATLGTWGLCWVFIALLKLAWAMLPFIVIAGVVYVLLVRRRGSPTGRR